MKLIHLLMPTTGSVSAILIPALMQPTMPGSEYVLSQPIIGRSGCTPLAMNSAWSIAMEQRAKYCLILNSDVGPPIGFVDLMMKAMGPLDVLAASLPFKHDGGLTQQAIMDDEYNCEYISLERERGLPLVYSMPGLVYSTACCMIKIGPWVSDFRGWRWESGLRDGQPYAGTEDYLFAHDAEKLGLLAGVFRGIRIFHEGRKVY